MPPIRLWGKGFFEKKKEADAGRIEKLDQKLVASLAQKRFPKIRQLKFLPQFLTSGEKRILQIGAMAALIGAAALVFFLTRDESHLVPSAGGTLREGLIGSPRFLNPIRAATDTDRDLTRLLFSSLVTYDTQGKLRNDLADRIEINENGTVYTVTLREAYWHDGEPVRAEDVLFTIRAIQDPAWKSPLWRSFKGVELSAEGERTVRFKLEKSYTPFLHSLTVGIAPAHLWKSLDPRTAHLSVLAVKPIGSGPWKVDSLTKTREGAVLNYTLKANERFYGAKPWIDTLAVSFYDNAVSAVRALKENKIDSLPFIPSSMRTDLPVKRVNAYPLELAGYTAVFFNARLNASLETSAVRRALELAVDRPSLARETGQKALGGIAELFSLPQVAGGEKDSVETSETLLTKDGWQKKDGAWQKDNKELTVALTLLNDPDYQKIAEAIKASWEALGVKVTLAAAEPTELRDILKTRRYEALLWSQILGGSLDLFPLWHSSQLDDPGLALISLRDRPLDTLLEELTVATDPAKTIELLQKTDAILRAQTPAIFLLKPVSWYAVGKKVHGVSLQTLFVPSDRFEELRSWYIKRKFVLFKPQ